jgi:hypothetical protein
LVIKAQKINKKPKGFGNIATKISKLTMSFAICLGYNFIDRAAEALFGISEDKNLSQSSTTVRGLKKYEPSSPRYTPTPPLIPAIRLGEKRLRG